MDIHGANVLRGSCFDVYGLMKIASRVEETSALGWMYMRMSLLCATKATVPTALPQVCVWKSLVRYLWL
jgi:hypothetical protein